MHALAAVLKDLYDFVTIERWGFGRKKPPRLLPSPERHARLSSPKPTQSTNTEKPQSISDLLERAELSVLQSAQKILKQPKESKQASPTTQTNIRTVGFVRVPYALVHILPTRMFDDVCGACVYGTRLEIRALEHGWCEVVAKDTHGWIREEELDFIDDQTEVRFVSGDVYDQDHVVTKRVRYALADSFQGAKIGLPLQSVEYVSFRLQQKGHQITWPQKRPRVAGSWQKILRGMRGIYCSIHPKTSSVMEYITDGDIGHLAYVEAVFPDESIAISALGFDREGYYSQHTLRKEEWKELRPVFIALT